MEQRPAARPPLYFFFRLTVDSCSMCTYISIIFYFLVFFFFLCAQGGGGGGGGGGNPANDLVAMVNADRASAKLPTLRNSKGLGCMALQYISRCSDKSGCADGGTLAPPCRPPETDITGVYAANCGVELPTVGVISGRIIGCGLHAGVYDFEITNATVFRGKDQTLVGVGVAGGFWCLLLSSGSPNSSFLLEDAGRGIAQTHGCFSDPDTLSCNASASASAAVTRRVTAGSSALAPLLPLLLFLL